MSRLSAILHRVVFPACLALLGVAVAVGQDAAPKRPEAPPPGLDVPKPAVVELAPAEIDKLISQLDAEEFEAREAASKKLVSGGASVVPAVEKGAGDENLEIATRCLAILKSLYEGKDVDAQADAAIALKRLCDSPNAAIARRAAAVIDPPKPANGGNPFNPGNPFGGLQPGIRINMRGIPLGGAGRQMQVTNNNGQVEVIVTEGERKVRVVHRDGNDITVEITEPPAAGKPAETKKFSAKNEDELKKKHPEAFKLYEEFGKQGADDVFVGNFPGGVFPPNVVPQMRRRNLPRGFRNIRPNPGRAAVDPEAVPKQLEGVAARLNALAERGDVKPAELKQLADDVTRIQKEAADNAKSIDEE